MALPGSGSISTTQIRTEIGGSGSVVIPSAEVRTLTGVASGPIVLPNDFWGKSSLSPAPSGTVLYDSSTPGAWSYTHSAYATQNVTIEIWGGGGAGYATMSGGKSPTFAYGGGGGGGYSKKTYSLANNGSLSGAVGAGGTAPSGFNENGTSGGASTCSTTGQTANGGNRADWTISLAGAGGAASGGDTNSTGTSGVNNSYGGGSPNGGANTSSGAGNAPGGGGYAASPGANGRVVVKAA